MHLDALREKFESVTDLGAFVIADGRAFAPTGHNGARLFSETELPTSLPPYGIAAVQDNPAAPIIVTEDVALAEAINAAGAQFVAMAPAPHLFGRTSWATVQGRDVVLVVNKVSFKITYKQASARLVAHGARVVGIAETSFANFEASIASCEAARKQASKEARGPDLTLLSRRLKPVAPIPTGLAGRWQGWINTMARTRATAPEYILSALLGTVSGLAAGRFGVEIQNSWREESPLWMIAVGSSGKGKTPGLNAVGGALEAIEADLLARHKTAVDAWEQGGKNGRRPVLDSLRIFDTTPEAAAVKLARVERGLIFWFEEATSFFNGLGRYGNETERAFYIKLHDAKPGAVDRRNLGDDPLIVPCLGGSIVGGVQPEVMRDFLASNEDGAKARLCYVWPSDVSSETIPVSDAEWQSLSIFVITALRFLVDLAIAGTGVVYIPFAADAKARFLAWRDQYLAGLEARHGDEIPSALAKGPGMVARVALAFALLDGSVDQKLPGTISDDAVHRAIDLWAHLVLHRQKVETDAHEPVNERVGRALARYLVDTGTDTINVSDLRRSSGIPELRDHRILAAALQELEEARWLQPGTRIPRNVRNAAFPEVVRLRAGLLQLLGTLKP